MTSILNQSPEVKSILKQTHDLTTALSNNPLGVAGRLLSKELICEEVYSEMFIDSYTPAKKAAILVKAVRNTVEIAPVNFQDFLEILSEQQVCAKEVVERLRSAYQNALQDADEAHGVCALQALAMASIPTDHHDVNSDQLDQVGDRGSSYEPADIASKIEALENRFDDLQTRIINELSTKPGITTKKVLSKLTGLPLSLRKEYESSIEKRIPSMRTETQIDDLFIFHLKPLSSFMDYRLIEYFIKQYGSDGLKKDMVSYCGEMVVFMKETTIEQLRGHLPGEPEVPPAFSKLQAKIGEDASKYTLEQVNKFRKEYCGNLKLSEMVVHLFTFKKSNSFIVWWVVPSALVSDIMDSARTIDQNFYQEYKITSLTLDGMWLFLSAAEIDAMWSRLHVNDKKFKDQFHTMYRQVVCELEMVQVTGHQLSSYFMRSLEYRRNTSGWLCYELLNHKLPVSIVDFRVLAAAIEGFGSDYLKRVMSSYSKYISTFLKKSTAQQLINLSAIKFQPSGYSIVECRIKKNPLQYELKKLLNFRTGFCTITGFSEFCFVMDEVATETSGSFTVSWLVPPTFISGIMKSTRNLDQNFYQEYKITSLTLDGMWLYMSKSEIDAMWSQMHVSDTKFEGQFHTMYKQIVYELEMAQITGHQLSLFFEKSLKYHQSASYSLSHELLNHELPVSVVDFRVLAAAIEGFGSDCLINVMSSYSKYISTFLKKSTAEQLINMSAIQKPSQYSIIKCRIKKKPLQYKLGKLFSFRTGFCTVAEVSELCFVMDEVNTEMSGSFTVSWLVPPTVISGIMKSNRKFYHSLYHKYNITSLTLDGMWLFLNEADIDAMWSQVQISDTKFKDQFRTMYKQIVCEMKVQNVSKDHLSLYFQSLNYQRQISNQLSQTLLEEEFPASLVDFGILKAVIEKFGSDCLKRVMSSYCNYMSIFTKESTAQQLINLSALQSKHCKHFVAAKCTIMEEPSHCGVEKLLQFRTRFCAIARCNEILCFVMDEVNMGVSGLFTVKWLVPSALVSDIIVKCAKYIDQSFYQEYKITSLTLDGMWLFLSEAEIDVTWLKMHVGDTEFKDQFHTMCKQIVCEMKVHNVSKDSLSSYFQSLKLRQISDQVSLAVLEEEFPASFIDFEVLKAVIDKFGSDCLKRMMRSYCNYMSIFTKESTAQQLVNLSVLQSKHYKHFVAAKCTIREEPSHYSLEKLLQFRTRFCEIARCNEACFIIDEINVEMSSSFTVNWLVPSALVSDIIVKSARNVDQSLYQEYKITSLTLNGMWLYLTKAEIDAMWLKMHVGDTEFSDQFHIMHKQILLYEVDEIGRSVATVKLSSYLMKQQPTLQRNVSVKISEAFLNSDFPVSLIDFKMLTIVIDLFGSNCLKRVMESYCHFMSTFVKQSTLEQLIDLSPIQSRVPEGFLEAECKIMGEPFEYGLEKLLKFQTEFCSMINIDKVYFVMGEVRKKMSDSFIVSWHVPSTLVSDNMIVKSGRCVDQSFYQEFKITSLTLDGMWIFFSNAEIDVLWHPSDFESQFLTMYRQIVCELKAQEISKNELSSYLMDQHPKLQNNASIQLSEAFVQHEQHEQHDFPLSVLDFRVLSIIIDKFGSDCLKSVMKSFCNSLKSIYTRESTVEQLVSLPSIRSQPSKYFISVESRNREDPSDCRLLKLFNFQARFCNNVNIDDVCFIMDKIKAEISGSFIVKWHIPSSIALDLLKSANQLKQTELFQEMNIPSLQLGGMWLYNYQLTPLGIQLRKRYRQSHGSPSPVEWIPSPTKKIFRLAMIQKKRVQRGYIDDRFVQMTISGRVDDILHAKSPVELEHIFRNTLHGGEIILIEGAPGSGKSTLTVRICQRWGKGELFQQFTVVILVQLRDPAVQKAQTIADLIPVENAEEIAAELTATNGCGILWILDGWDELPPHLQQDSIFYHLIKRMLSECSVIVTSRPISSGDLHPVVSSRIEVLGFTPEEQRQYFTECLKEDTKALQALLEKIQENPMVQSICYLPLNAAFVVHTFKYRDQSLPNTEYEIYLSVILSCIQRHCDREGRSYDLPRELASLDDLSRIEAVREPFQCLCELAYRGVMENKVTFSSSDLPQGSNTLSLLQAIESFLQSGKSVFYNFLHLSVQEVLSAYYITTRLSDSEQVSQFQQLFNQPRFAAVFQFYAAITKLKSPGIREVIDRIVEAKSKPLLVSLLRCLHEAQDPSLCLYVAERLEYKLDLYETSLSPLDCLSISFFLSCLSGKKICVNLDHCSIGDFGAKYLSKHLHANVSKMIIDLSGNEIYEEGALHIARMLFYLEHLYSYDNPIGDTGASLIFKAVRETATLKTLILYHCGITSSGAQDLARGLAQNNSLEKLDISDNSLGDEGVSHVAEALKQSAQLKELWIGECGMTDKGAASVASALTVNNSLKMLHMGGRVGALKKDGLSIIAHSLANKSLFVKLEVPSSFGYSATADNLGQYITARKLANPYSSGPTIADHLSQEVNEARKRNGLPPIEIEATAVSSLRVPSKY